MMFMRRSNNKKLLIALFGALLLVGIGAYVFIVQRQLPPDITLTPTASPEDTEGSDYADLYAKELQLGDKKINLAVKSVTLHADNGDWPYAEYQFSTTGSKPQLLAKVDTLTPPQYENGVDSLFSLKDITGDGVPELFILLQQSGSNLRDYEILTLNGDTLVNITTKANGENSKQIDFDDIALKGRYIAMTWHGPTSGYEVGRNDYLLSSDHSLSLVRSLVFDYGEDGESCDVKRKDAGDSEFRIIAHVEKCGNTLDDFDAFEQNI